MRHRVAIMLALAALGCGPGTPGESSVCSLAARISNGSPDPAPLELSPEQRAAIVALDVGAVGFDCSGTLISRDWVLSAAHCAQADQVIIRTSNHARTLAITKHELHSRLDAMLVEIEPAAREELGAVPLAIWTDPINEGWIGMPATLAGLGATETGATGQLFFAREPIADVEPEAIVMDGHGRTGACVGDSGGPLMMPDASGQPRVAGLLEQGSSDCLGIDVYTRADAISDWVRNVTGAAGARGDDHCF